MTSLDTEQQCVMISDNPHQRPFQQAVRSFSKSASWSDSSYSPGGPTPTYFVEWGEAVTVCAPHCHTTLKNQYSTGGETCAGPWCLLTLQNYSKRGESTERGLEKNTKPEDVLTITSESREEKRQSRERMEELEVEIFEGTYIVL